MIHTKNLQFNYNDIDFQAMVTYSDAPFRSTLKDSSSVFYDVKLHKPEALECGGEVVTVRGGISFMLFMKKAEDRQYIYMEDMDYEEENKVNVYPKAVKKILYAYFNKDLIAHYKQKISLLENALDKKYEQALLGLQKKKLALRKEMKSGEIDSKVYQKRYKPIRLKNEEIEFKIFRCKHNYERRYFQCCELRPRYRAVADQKLSFCNDKYTLCGLTSFLAKTKI